MIDWVIRNKSVLLTILLIIGGAAGIEWYGASKYNLGVRDATADMQRKLDALAKEQQIHMKAASEYYDKDKAEREKKEKVQYVEVQKVVEKPVYRNVCLDDAGLHELNSAITGK